MKILRAITPLGTFESPAKEWTPQEEDEVIYLIKASCRNEVNYFELETVDGPLFFAGDTLKNTIFRIVTL